MTLIADALQPGTRTFADRGRHTQSGRRPAAGLYCTVELKISRKSPVLIVPASAIIFNQSGKQIAVVENGIVHLYKIASTEGEKEQ